MKNYKAKRRAQSEQRESPSGETYSHALISLFSLVTDVKNEITELRKEQQTSRERMTSLQEQIAKLSEHISPNLVCSPSSSHATTNSDVNGERSRQDNNKLYGPTSWPPYYVGDAIKPIVYNGPMGPYTYNPSYSYVSTFDARHDQPYFHSHLSSNATHTTPYIQQASRRPPSNYFTRSLSQTETPSSQSSTQPDKLSPSRAESQQAESPNGLTSPVKQTSEGQEEDSNTGSKRTTRSSTKSNQQKVTTRRSSYTTTAKKRAPPKLPSPVLPPKRRARTIKSYRIETDSEIESTDESEQEATKEMNVGNKKQTSKEEGDGEKKSNSKMSNTSQGTSASEHQFKEKEKDEERNNNDQEEENSKQDAHELGKNTEDSTIQENMPESDKPKEDTKNTDIQEASSSEKSSNAPIAGRPLLPIVIPTKHITKRYGRQTVNPKATLVDGDFFGIISMKQKEEEKKQKNDGRSSSDNSVDDREHPKPSEMSPIQNDSYDEHAKNVTQETANDTQEESREEAEIVKEQAIEVESEADKPNLKTKKAKQTSVNYDSDASGLSYLSATDNNTDTEIDDNAYNLTAKEQSTSLEKVTHTKELEFELTPEEQLASEGLLIPLIRLPLNGSKSATDADVQKVNLKKYNRKKTFEREVKLLGVEKKEIKKLGDYRERKLRPRFEKKRLHIY